MDIRGRVNIGNLVLVIEGSDARSIIICEERVKTVTWSKAYKDQIFLRQKGEHTIDP